MNSPQGSARTPARLDRDGSISPQPLESTNDSPGPTSSSSLSKDISHDKPGRVISHSFPKLPSSVIARILWSVDADVFASLSVLNRQWRQESEKVELYAHHLSRCPSYALSNSIISGPFRKNDLSRIKAKFAAEVRRNLFEAYLRPRRTLINLVSFHTNSSAAFPTGEAFRFEFSPNSCTILALSSSRIYVIDATTDPPVVKRQLKTMRRALSASITDDGSLLAVLSSKHQVNVYALTSQGVQHLQVIVLDNPPKIIAIAHEGTVLAASYETGIEVFSLAANSLTTDRRAVRSEAVDTLNFSGDGSMLVGSSLSLNDPNAVVISAPFYTENDPDLSAREVHSRMWTTQILFPQISSVCSHVTLLPGHTEGDACWLFAFDHSLMSYRAVRTDDTRAGVAYFLSPPGTDRFDTPIPTIAPSASACGTLAVAGFEGPGLWLYGIPERLDLCPDMGAVVERQNERQVHGHAPLTSATGNFEPLIAYSPANSASDYFIEDDSLAGKVDWRQSLFVKCRYVFGLTGQIAARWVEYNEGCKKRLIVVAPGGVSLDQDELGGEVMPVDGSRMCLFDFDYGPSMDQDRVLTIEVGEGQAELLTEHTGSLAAEVAMERRRTIRAIPTAEGSRAPLGRSITSISPPSIPLFENTYRQGSVSTPSSPVDGVRPSQQQATSSLQRSVTASGFRHARYPPRPPLGSTQYVDQDHAGFQRATYYGRPISEDSWETPPPPYTGANSPPVPRHSSYGSAAPLRTHLSAQFQGLAITGSTSPQLAHPHFRPYRALSAESAEAPLDTVMTSHAMPSSASITQHDELMMAARSRGPSEASPDVATERSLSSRTSPRMSSGGRLSMTTRRNLESPRRARPMTHHGDFSQGWQGLDRNAIPMPLTPTTTSMSKMTSEEHDIVSPVSSASILSLTGANLQNRLNHPVPPVPPVPPIPESTSVFKQAARFSQHIGSRDEPQSSRATRDTSNYPTMPTIDQMAKLNHRISQSEMSRPAAIKNTNFVHKPPTANVPPSPPRGAWGATGVPGSPTFNQARNVPNGYTRSRSNSRNSQASNMASASAPNLLAQRPKYGRLDTIDSMNDVAGVAEGNISVRSRAHSMTQTAAAPNMEPSAYHETSRSGTGVVTGKYGKKAKKIKEETTRRGIRCVVM